MCIRDRSRPTSRTSAKSSLARSRATWFSITRQTRVSCSRAISLSGHVVLDHSPDTGVVFPGDLAHLGNWHRRGEGDEQRLEQQGESRPRTSPRDVDLVYPVLMATHPRQTSMQVGLVLKEVEMAPLLVLGVVHRTRLLPAAIDWARETPHGKGNRDTDRGDPGDPFGVKICPCHFPTGPQVPTPS